MGSPVVLYRDKLTFMYKVGYIRAKSLLIHPHRAIKPSRQHGQLSVTEISALHQSKRQRRRPTIRRITENVYQMSVLLVVSGLTFLIHD